jgi:hypothetical protein
LGAKLRTEHLSLNGTLNPEHLNRTLNPEP